MMPDQRELLQESQKFAQSAPSAEALMDRIAKRLHEKMTRYKWVGCYLVDPADANYLVVGPFAGSFTPNQRFSLQVGLCGAAATSGKSGGTGRDERSAVSGGVVDGEVGDCGADFCESEAGGGVGYRELFCGHVHGARAVVRGRLRSIAGRLSQQETVVGSFKLCGEGKHPKTFLLRGQAGKGQKLD
jgi:hypothetical protein